MRPKVLGDGLRRNWVEISCEETIKYFLKDIDT